MLCLQFLPRKRMVKQTRRLPPRESSHRQGIQFASFK